MSKTIDESIKNLSVVIGKDLAHELYNNFNTAYRKKHGCFTEKGEDYFIYLAKKEDVLERYFQRKIYDYNILKRINEEG